MHYRFLLILIISISFITVQVTYAQVPKNQRYTVSLIQMAVKDDEDASTIENYAAIFSQDTDTVIIYKWNKIDGEKPSRYTFWAEGNSIRNTIRFLSSDGADIKVTFLPASRIAIDHDVYFLNKPYYDFMKQKLLLEKSVLDLAFFLKDGYGDYDSNLEPLTRKNWRNQKENPAHKIISVDVKNKNHQTDDQFHRWTATYTYNAIGILKGITGQYYTKKLFLNTGSELIYHTDQNLDRTAIETRTYQNRKTLRDSVVVSWTQLSTAKDFHYSTKQSKLKILSVEQKPGNFLEITRLLDFKK